MEVPYWVKLVFLATALTCFAVQASGNAQEETPSTVVSPADQCGALTLPDDKQACLQEYIANRLYQQSIDPTRAAVSAAFPALCVVAAALLALKMVHG